MRTLIPGLKEGTCFQDDLLTHFHGHSHDRQVGQIKSLLDVPFVRFHVYLAHVCFIGIHRVIDTEFMNRLKQLFHLLLLRKWTKVAWWKRNLEVSFLVGVMFVVEKAQRHISDVVGLRTFVGIISYKGRLRCKRIT